MLESIAGRADLGGLQRLTCLARCHGCRRQSCPMFSAGGGKPVSIRALNGSGLRALSDGGESR
jgi:hypothetical protein